MKNKLLLLLTYIIVSSGLMTLQSQTLSWAERMGGTGNDYGNFITKDASGNVYTTGAFEGTEDFDPGTGTYNLTSAGGYDIFISKLDVSGNFVWAKRMGGTSSDVGTFMALDASGNVYITGYFYGIADFDPGTGTYNLTSAGGYDIFISKLDVSGNFVWARKMGGVSYDIGFSIAVDASANVYTTGFFSETVDFDPGTGTYNLTSAGLYEIFISKLSASGNFVWAKRMGGTSDDGGRSIAVDASANIYIAGVFSGTADFDPGTGTYNLISAGNLDIFILKLDASGNFVWARQMGGTFEDYAMYLAVDASGNIYSTGYFSGTADFDPGAGTYNLISAGDLDIFISKLDTSGNFLWAQGLGGSSQDWGFFVALDPAGSGYVYTTGQFSGTADFDPGAGTYNLSSAGVQDIFISKLDASGNFVWAKRIGGTGADVGRSIVVDITGSGDIYTTGGFSGTADFDPDAGTYNLTSAGGYDIFVHKLSLYTLATVTTQAVNSITGTTATGNGNITGLGIPNPTAYGVCWNTIGMPTLANSYTNNGAVSATGPFTSPFTGLSPNTTYYVRAYATNSGGTAYGNEVSFTTYGLPTVTTQAVTGITATTATGNGNITVLGSPNPTAHGVCWNTAGTPTLVDSYINIGAVTAIGAFTASITGLTPVTTYYVRAFATNAVGTVYGNEVSFISSGIAPTVTTQAVTAITATTATGNGTITSLGVPNPTNHGVCWNTSSNPTISNSHTNNGAASATGPFTTSITGLAAGTLYYVRAFATNSVGTVYGSQVSFTSYLAPTVTTQAVTAIMTTTATGNGNITVLGVPNPTAHGVCWNTTGTPTLTDSYVNKGTATATGAFTASITGITPGTLYYVRAYATNATGTAYGNQVSFTSYLAPSVTTQAVTAITATSGTGNGNITVLGVPNPSAHGVCWNTAGVPTLTDSYVNKGTATTTGAFTASIAGLSPNITYYVRAYATNSTGTVYGNEVSFNTVYGSLIWTGYTDTDWNVAGNWNNNTIPNLGDDATVPDVSGTSGNFPAVAVNAECHDLTINSGAQVTIDPDGSLTAGGATVNNGAILIQSGASGIGSFIDNGISGSGIQTVQVYLTCNQYHSFTPPITDALSGVFKLPFSYMPDVYLYQNIEATYNYFEIVPLTIPLNSMEGYMVWVDGLSAAPPATDWTFDFTGTLATGTAGSAGNMVISSPGGLQRGWNFAGNPYPSAIDWNAASGWTKTGLDATIYIYNNGTWATCNSTSGGTNGGSQYIPVSQGFFVKVTDSGSGYPVTATLMMNNSVRVHNGVAYLKDEIASRVMLQVSSESRTDETGILIHPEATPSFDSQLDAYKIISDEYGVPQIYSVSDVKYAMNCLPAEEPVIIGVRGSMPGEALTISLTDNGQHEYLYLEDTYTGQITDLNNGSYTFNYMMDQDNRFVLHFAPLAVPENPAGRINIYAVDLDVYVAVPLNTEGNVIAYDLMGREAGCMKITAAVNKLTLDKTGCYIIEVISEGSVVTKKVFVK